MTKTAAELEAEVEASRAELDHTVEALKEKMTPTALFDDFKGSMKGAGNQMLSNIADKASTNPLPLLVIGAGVAWLLMGNNSKPSYSSSNYGGGRGFSGGYPSDDDYGDAYDDQGGRGLKRKVSDAASAAGDKVSGLAGAASDKVSGIAGAASDKVHDLASSAKDAASSARSGAADAARNAKDKIQSVAGSARETAINVGQQAQDTFYDTLHREPLIIGALGLAVGAAIGVSLPSTAFEDQKVGGMRDDLVNKGKDLVQGQVDTAKQAAGAAYSTVKSELKQGEGGDESLADKVARVAQAGVQSVQDAVKPHDAAPAQPAPSAGSGI